MTVHHRQRGFCGCRATGQSSSAPSHAWAKCIRYIREDWNVRGYRKSDREEIKNICKDVYGGSDYIPRVLESYEDDGMVEMFVLEEVKLVEEIGTSQIRKSSDSHMDTKTSSRDSPRERPVVLGFVCGREDGCVFQVWGARTHPEFRGKGVMKSLLMYLHEWVDQHKSGMECIMSTTIESNLPMKHLFQKLEYTQIARVFCWPSSDVAKQLRSEGHPLSTLFKEHSHVNTQPARTQSASTQPARTQSASTQPARTQSASTQPARTQSASTQPAITQSRSMVLKDSIAWSPCQSPEECVSVLQRIRQGTHHHPWLPASYEALSTTSPSFMREASVYIATDHSSSAEALICVLPDQLGSKVASITVNMNPTLLYWCIYQVAHQMDVYRIYIDYGGEGIPNHPASPPPWLVAEGIMADQECNASQEVPSISDCSTQLDYYLVYLHQMRHVC